MVAESTTMPEPTMAAESQTMPESTSRRLTQGMPEQEAVIAMSGLSPATLLLLNRLFLKDYSKAMDAMIVLDKLGIYGSSIFKLYADVCQGDDETFYNKMIEFDTTGIDGTLRKRLTGVLESAED